MPDRRVRPVIEREPERPRPKPGRHILPIGEMLMFPGLELSQEPKPAKGIKNLAPDHARNPVVKFSGIRRAIEYFPQGAAGLADQDLARRIRRAWRRSGGEEEAERERPDPTKEHHQHDHDPPKLIELPCRAP